MTINKPMSQVFLRNDIPKIIALIEDRLVLSPKTIIGLDGDTGSGKSWLASKITMELGLAKAIHIELDRYLEGDCDLYTNQLDYVRLLKNFVDFEQSEAKCLLLDGICVAEVADRVGVRLDLHIIIHRHKDDIEDWPWLWEVELESRRSMLGRSGMKSPIGRSLIDYVHKYHPGVNAHVRYSWDEDLVQT